MNDTKRVFRPYWFCKNVTENPTRSHADLCEIHLSRVEKFQKSSTGDMRLRCGTTRARRHALGAVRRLSSRHLRWRTKMHSDRPPITTTACRTGIERVFPRFVREFFYVGNVAPQPSALCLADFNDNSYNTRATSACTRDIVTEFVTIHSYAGKIMTLIDGVVFDRRSVGKK